MKSDAPTSAAVRDNFFSTLPACSDFDGITDQRYYREAPDDWFIVITDVRGSTKAVEQGRYKEVNTLGAATIISASNACSGLELPFVFGGDGATLLVPPSHREQVLSALNFVRLKSQQDFNLSLRIGCVPVSAVRALGKSVLVARCRLSEGNYIAMFAGGGLNEATRMIKMADSAFLVEGSDEAVGDMEGLECRWCAVPARRDGMLSLMIHVPDERFSDYRTLLNEIRTIAPDAMPITEENLPDRWPPEFLMHEARMKKSGWLAQWLHYLSVVLLTGLLTIVVRKTRHQPESAAARYIASLCRNNDYLKLDDYLRMVIDVTQDQRQQIEALLDSHADNHDLVWGSHFSETALFTCMVKSEQIHLHFVDGNNGGYTAAARDMEARETARRLAQKN